MQGYDVAANRKVAPYPGKDDGRQIDYIWQMSSKRFSWPNFVFTCNSNRFRKYNNTALNNKE